MNDPPPTFSVEDVGPTEEAEKAKGQEKNFFCPRTSGTLQTHQLSSGHKWDERGPFNKF